MKSMSIICVLLVAAAGVRADDLQVTGQTRQGTFQGYENMRFQFMSTKGRFLKEHGSRVIKLTLDRPQNAAYTTADNPKEQIGKLKGYDKKKFILTQKDGKEIQVAQAKMKKIELLGDETAGGGAGDGVDSGNRYPIPKIDLGTLTGGGNLNPAQQAAVTKFKEAKQAYDAFLTASSEMVAQMDQMKGAKREEMLNQLRVRKGEEQPLKNALVSAFKTLTDQFAE